MESKDSKIHQLYTKFNISGDKDIMLYELRLKLKECGWKEAVAKICHQVINETGVDNITVDKLVEQVTPKARELVPSDIKREMLIQIQAAIEKRINTKGISDNDEL